MDYSEKIKQIPITDFADRIGYTVIRAGRKHMTLAEHDSVRIDVERNCFWRNSTGGTGSIIDFAMEFEGFSTAKEAMDFIADTYGISKDDYRDFKPPESEIIIGNKYPKREAGDLALPPRSDNMDAVYDYLLNKRKINKDIIDYFVDKDMLYQDLMENAVFKTDRFACQRSTGEKRFVRDVDGCDYNDCFFFKGKENVDSMIVCESVIDVMSVMSINAQGDKDFNDYAYLALSGTNKLEAVFNNLDKEQGIKNIILALDNDNAGLIAIDRITQTLEEKYPDIEHSVLLPTSGKDWNEFLINLRGFEERQQEIRKQNLENKLDVKEFGKIMQSIFEVAASSSEPTWFVERDSFEDGEFTQEDLDELNEDISRLKNQYGIDDIHEIIECSDDWQSANDVVATFHGDFIDIFDADKILENTVDRSYTTKEDNDKEEAREDKMEDNFETKGVEFAEQKSYKYYSLHRPISVGTYPKDGLKTFENFDDKTFVPEINNDAWGMLVYERKLTDKELDEFELTGISKSAMQLSDRLSGEELEKVKSLVSDLRLYGADIDDESGIINLYHSTDKKMADTILKIKRIKAEKHGDINGVLLSTEPMKDADTIIKLSVPVEELVIRNYDIDTDEIEIYLPSDNRFLDVKDYNAEIIDIPHREEKTLSEEDLDFITRWGLSHVKEQTPEVCLAAVRINGSDLQFVKNQSSEICMEAVKQSGYALRYVKEQTPEICLEAVKQTGEALKFVEDQTPEICLEAVKQSGLSLRYVEEQTPEICLEAMKQNPLAMEFVVEQTPELCMEAVKQSGYTLRYVKEQTPEVCLEAIKEFPRALSFVKEQTPELCLEAVKRDGKSLQFVQEQTPELCSEAINQYPKALRFVKKQTPEICLEAVKQDGNALQFVHEQTPELCIEAVKQNPLAMEFVVEQTPEICLEAVKQNQDIIGLVNDEFKDFVMEQLNSHEEDKALSTKTEENEKDSSEQEENKGIDNSEQTKKHIPRETISLVGANKDQIKEHLMNGIHSVLNSDDYKDWLNTGSKLLYNNYSFNNAMLIWMQKENASYVMGYDAWKDFGRSVKQGAKSAKILMPVMAYEKEKDGLYKMIISNLEKNLSEAKKENINIAEYRLFASNIVFTMNENHIVGLKVGDNEKGLFNSEQQLKKFISNTILGKVPMYFSTGNVFDIADVEIPEYLWMKKGFTKEELALDENGKPQKNRKGEYKIKNTEERIAKFHPVLDTSIETKNPEKMKKLKEVLIAVSENNGIPVYMKTENVDNTLKQAKGYFSRAKDENNPKGFIVIKEDLKIAEMCSVLIHEMAHSDMHGNLEKLNEEFGEKVTRDARELQAESVAYMTASMFGLETSTSSFNYLTTYSNGFELKELQKSMDIIYKECKKLTTDIQKELDKRGLNLDLSEKDVKEIDNQEFVKEIVSYSLKQETEIDELSKSLPQMVVDNKDKEENMKLLSELKDIIAEQKADIEFIKDSSLSIRELSNQNKINEVIKQMNGVNERITDRAMRIDVIQKDILHGASLEKQNQENIKADFIETPVKAFSTLSDKYPKLKEMTEVQKHYICNSEYIRKQYSSLLDNNPDKFVDVILQRAEAVKEVIAKNGSFIEVDFCEQWTDKPIIESGTLLHPKVANTIVKEAEQQIRNLKNEAEKNNDYFPYSKCSLTIFGNDGKDRYAVSSRVDIGDGMQNDLLSYFQQFSMEGIVPKIISDIQEAEKEDKTKDKILSLSPEKIVSLENDVIVDKSHSEDAKEETVTMKKCKEKIADVKKQHEGEEKQPIPKGRNAHERV